MLTYIHTMYILDLVLLKAALTTEYITKFT